MQVSKIGRTLVFLVGASLIALITGLVSVQASAGQPVRAAPQSRAVPAAGSTRTASIAGISCTAPSSCTAAITLTEGDISNPIVSGELWNGTTWTPHPMKALTAVASGALSAVSCNSPDRCVAVGTFTEGNIDRPVVAGEYWNGKTWTLDAMPLPKDTTAGSITAVSCTVSAVRCMAVGTFSQGDIDRPVVAGEYWNGKTWTLELMPLPKNVTSGSVSGLSCTSLVSCVAVGTFTLGDLSNPVVLGEAWDGKTWTLHALPLP